MHSFVIGPRMLALQESVTDESQIASMRRLSIIISAINAVLALGILFCAALLEHRLRASLASTAGTSCAEGQSRF